MTTTISPSTGHGPWMQGGVGASPGYDAADLRRSVTAYGRGEGVSTYGSFRVSQRGAGANLSVDVNMDEMAFVRGDSNVQQQIYDIAPHNATINESIATADATNPRIDRVVLQVLDSTFDSGGSYLAQTRVITGTPTGGATLDNLTGAAAVPVSSLLLADVLVAATDTSISNSEIRDRRAFVAGIPPVLTAVDMVIPTSPLPLLSWDYDNDIQHAAHDTCQSAVLVYVPRRIVSATRLRWKYQHGLTALTGNYLWAIHDASGRQIVSTGSVAVTGATESHQVRSETISATTFEAGWYYALFCLDSGAGSAGVVGWAPTGGTPSGSATVRRASTPAPNMFLARTSGGVTAPTTLAAFTDTNTAITTAPKVPEFALSVG